LEHEYPILNIGGSFGEPANCTWVQVGKGKYGLLVKQFYCSTGSADLQCDLIGFDGWRPERLLSVGKTFQEGDPGYNAEDIGNSDGSLIFKTSDKIFWDAIFKTGYRNRPEHSESTIFVYQNGSYYQPGTIGIQLMDQDREAELRRSGGRKVLVMAVFPDTPAAKSGLRPIDQIVSVDGFPVDYRNNDEISNLIRGIPGTTVRLRIKRAGTEQTICCKRVSSVRSLQIDND
jgi:hypothetical protein